MNDCPYCWAGRPSAPSCPSGRCLGVEEFLGLAEGEEREFRGASGHSVTLFHRPDGVVAASPCLGEAAREEGAVLALLDAL